ESISLQRGVSNEPCGCRGVARGWDSEFESALLQRRVMCEPDLLGAWAGLHRLAASGIASQVSLERCRLTTVQRNDEIQVVVGAATLLPRNGTVLSALGPSSCDRGPLKVLGLPPTR